MTGPNVPEQVKSIDEAMKLAIEHSYQVKGTTYPNPPVGAVIVDQEGRVVGPDDLGDPRLRRMDRRQAGQRQHLPLADRHMLPTQARQAEGPVPAKFLIYRASSRSMVSGFFVLNWTSRLR